MELKKGELNNVAGGSRLNNSIFFQKELKERGVCLSLSLRRTRECVKHPSSVSLRFEK